MKVNNIQPSENFQNHQPQMLIVTKYVSYNGLIIKYAIQHILNKKTVFSALNNVIDFK